MEGEYEKSSESNSISSLYLQYEVPKELYALLRPDVLRQACESIQGGLRL